MGEAPGRVLLIAALMGVVSYAALHHASFWFRRREPLRLWILGWCGATQLLLVGHVLVLTGGTGARALAGIRLVWTGVIASAPLLAGLSHALVRRAPDRRTLGALAGAGAALLALLWSGLLVGPELVQRRDLTGLVEASFRPSPRQLLLAAVLAWGLGWSVRVARRAHDVPLADRLAWLAALAAYTLLGLQDLLHVAGVITSVRLFDVSFVALALGLTFVQARRHERLHTHLEEEVALRTRELEARRERLEALVRAGRSVMADLDQATALQRIIEETARIARTPHVKVMLVDEQRQVFTVPAAMGAGVPPGFTVPVDRGLVGEVRRTRARLFSPDVRNDPRNLLAERDRREGIATFLGLPIQFGDAFLGVLTLNTEAPYVWSEDELEVLGLLADQAAVAIHNARLYERSAAQGRRLETLSDLTQRFTATLDVQQVLERVVQHAVELFGSSTSRLWLIDEEAPDTITLAAEAGARTRVSGLTRMALGEGFVGRIAASGRPIVVEDVNADPRRLNVERHRTEGSISFAGVPLLIEGRAIGALAIASRERRAFGPEDVSLLQSLANHAALALRNARLYAAAEERARELAALGEVGSAVVSSLDLERVLDGIAEWAVRLIEADGAVVRQLDERDGRLHARVVRGFDPRDRFPLAVGQGAVGTAALRREPVWSADVQAAPPPGYEAELAGAGRPLGEVVRDRGFRAILAVPMVSHDRLLGVIAVGWREPHTPPAREIRLLTAFAHQAAVAMEHADLYARLGERLRRTQTLGRLNQLISAALDRDRVLEEIVRAAAEVMGSNASLWLADERERRLELVGAAPEAYREFPVRTMGFDEGAAGWIAASRQPLTIDDALADPRVLARDWMRARGLRSLYGFPILRDGQVLAVLVFVHAEPIRVGPDEREMLESLSAQAAVAIRNAALYEAEAAARREAELALKQVKQLQGMLPICAYCKKIRNDRNYWETIESYIGERSQATFSHGICPECRDSIVKPELERWKAEQRRD